MSVWRHVLAIALLPVMAAIVLPALIVVGGDDAIDAGWGLLGLIPIGVGFFLWAWTVRLFATVGEGTLAPWDPTSNLVVRGPYRHVRNPMISGVLFVLLGEAAMFGSTALLIWAAAFFAVNALYMPVVEEPGLRRRFGDEYDAYRANVPAWLPRLRPWPGPADVRS